MNESLTPLAAAPQAGQAPDTLPEEEARGVAYVVKETITSILIAFVMVFVFRGFVLEPFLIPTGSMAPTLLGAHMRFTSPASGYSWAVGPWDMQDDGLTPLHFQGGQPTNSAADDGVFVHDPMSGAPAGARAVPIRWGDRIFVAKFPYDIVEPGRWDVMVFRNPRNPSVNYIKRLLGLPGEMVAIVDGDVFVRTPAATDGEGDVNPWSLPGWRAQVKPALAQRALWQPLFNSEYTPRLATDNFTFLSPWLMTNVGEEGTNWSVTDAGVYTYRGRGPATLAWNTRDRPVTDSYAYNETPRRSSLEFPVSDLRVRLSLPASGRGLSHIGACMVTRRHTFRLTYDIALGTAQIMMGEGEDKRTQMNAVAQSSNESKPAEGPLALEFIHVDQTLSVVRNGRVIAAASYAWSPQVRIENVVHDSLDIVTKGPEYLAYEANYRRPTVAIELTPSAAGTPIELAQVGLDRDVYYQADLYRYHADDGATHSLARRPALATHPLSTLVLGPDEFFLCGDNSPQSLDGRLWDAPGPWAATFAPRAGVVSRSLLIGRAFLVYLPAPVRMGRMLLPDLGRVRWIW